VEPERRRSWYGWGWEDEAVPEADAAALGQGLAAMFGLSLDRVSPPRPDEVDLPASRVRAPGSLPPLRTGTRDRAGHTYGKAFRDVARAFDRRWENPPDAVAYPRSERDVVALLDWAVDAGVALIPYGGGSSVVGGVEPDPNSERPVVSVDLRHLSGVVEVDTVSRAARIRAGTFGPDADRALRVHGLSMRHFPQSYEHSTVGGWVATRSGGHFATGPTHIDDLVESVRAVTPVGLWESRRLPASGAGPSPDRLLLGSEGTLGVITEVWLRVHERPRWRSSAALTFASLDAAAAAARACAQSGLQPSNCRLLDPTEAVSAGVTDSSSLLLVGFESADHSVRPWLDRAVEIAQDLGGRLRGPVRHSGPGADGTVDAVPSDADPASAWREAFLRAPYLRDVLVSFGVIAETFETACTWEAFPDLHRRVVAAVQDVLAQVCGGGQVGMRVTHVYPDGPAPYYTVLAPGRTGSLVAQWDEVKAAASEAITAAGGTITHHHAVGRTHRPGYDDQRPAPFAAALAAAKHAVDPHDVLHPGLLT
jgi:alkyldihydroxyacetonephosphate synthase